MRKILWFDLNNLVGINKNVKLQKREKDIHCDINVLCKCIIHNVVLCVSTSVGLCQCNVLVNVENQNVERKRRREEEEELVKIN